MSLSPDQSRFTACVVGESLPEEQVAFDQALGQDPALRREAEALQQTARQLAAALKQEPPVMLTNAQRQGVLEPGGVVSPAKKPARPAWWGPTLVTTGIAAAVAAGVFFLPAPPKSVMPSVKESGIPAVSIQPASVAKTGHKPVSLPPPVTTGSQLPATIPDTTGPQSPAALPPSGSMAALPPVLDVPAAPPPAKKDPVNSPAPPVRSVPGKPAPGEALGSGAPR
jgi:hypothetical protein